MRDGLPGGAVQRKSRSCPFGHARRCSLALTVQCQQGQQQQEARRPAGKEAEAGAAEDGEEGGREVMVTPHTDSDTLTMPAGVAGVPALSREWGIQAHLLRRELLLL